MSTTTARGRWRGYEAVQLRSAGAEISVVPQAGARIVSLRSLRSGREWLWSAADGGQNATPARGTPFENGPLAGIDECIPTVAPCRIHEQAIPDHGDAWTAPWALDEKAWAAGEIATSVVLESLPLAFSRRISLAGGEVRLRYRVENRSPRSQRYLWAMHPLLTWEAGDRIELTGPRVLAVTASAGVSASAGRVGEWPTWGGAMRLDEGSLGSNGPAYLKGFMPTAPDGVLAISNPVTGARLRITVDPRHVPAWGYWVSANGGWCGHSQRAIEPTNAAVDALNAVRDGDTAAVLGPGESRGWDVRLELA